jgi:hypothetical protein
MREYELDFPGVLIKINVSTEAKEKDENQKENIYCGQNYGCVNDFMEKLAVFLSETLIEHNSKSHDEIPAKRLLHIWKYFGGKIKTFRKAIRNLTS